MKLESILSNYCRRKNQQEVLELLAKHSNTELIDVTFNEGICFKHAVINNQPIIFKALLDYYKNTKLNNKDLNPFEHAKSLSKLKSMLTDIVENHEVSYEIKDLSRDYLPYDIHSDLHDIKIKTSLTGLRVPYLDNIKEDPDLEDLEVVLEQLKDIEKSLKHASQFMYIAKLTEQTKAVNESITLLEDHYELSDLAELDVQENIDDIDIEDNTTSSSSTNNDVFIFSDHQQNMLHTDNFTSEILGDQSLLSHTCIDQQS